MFEIPIFGSRSYGKLTQAFGTVITRLVHPRRGAYTRLTSLWYNCSTTAHTLTIMRPLGKTTVASLAAAGQAVINITADPGVYSAYGTINTANNVIAANDFCVYQTADGGWVLDTVASVATLAITMTTNVPTATAAAGAPFFFYGIITDTNPANNLAHEQFTMPASTPTYLGTDPGQGVAGFFETIPGPEKISGWPLSGMEEPLIIHSGNATAAGVLELVTAVYTGR